jgi:hypothetical protein
VNKELNAITALACIVSLSLAFVIAAEDAASWLPMEWGGFVVTNSFLCAVLYYSVCRMFGDDE